MSDNNQIKMFQALAQVKLSILDEKDYQLLSKREIKLNSSSPV